jgi:hypothetical protein
MDNLKLNLWRMNMRKLLVLAGLALTGILGIGAPAAYSQTYDINCTAYSTGGSWPNNGAVEYCGTTSEMPALKALAQTSQTALSSVTGTAQTAVGNANANFTIFANITEAKDYYTERGSTPPAFSDVGAQTIYGANNTPQHSFVFQTAAGVTNGQIGLGTGHELGHWADKYLGAQLNPKVTTLMSATTLWTNLVSSDFTSSNTRLNTFTSNKVTYNSPCFANGTQGVFTGYSGKNGTMICTGSFGQGSALNTGYSGSNKNILSQQAWPAIYNSAKELWAEEFAVYITNFNDYGNNASSIDKYLPGTIDTQSFFCTTTYMVSINQLGTEPVQQLENNNCAH